jgi:hypothetical protein
MRWAATGLLTAKGGYHRLSHYRHLSVLVDHLAAKKDENTLEASRDKLPDWLQGEDELVEDGHHGQSAEATMSRDSCVPVLTEQIA